MKSLLIVLTGLIALAGCSTFEGVAGDPGETNTATYNMPGLKVIPYNNPVLAPVEPLQELEVCEGLIEGQGIPRCSR